MTQPNGQGPELTALLIAPDRDLAAALTRSLPEARAFQILADLRSYPPRQTLEIRLRQYAPEVVLVDVASDFGVAVELIRCLSHQRPPVHVVGLHVRNDPDALLGALRAGATEFLYAPFEAGAQQEAAARIRRLRQPEAAPQRQPGRVVAFASAKPGSGASALASQTAFALQRLSGRRVLVADLDLMSGTISFYLKLKPGAWLVEALTDSGRMDPARWSWLVENAHGLDVLPAPLSPAVEPLDPARLHELCEYARQLYDWVILDLPTIFQRFSLLALSECDQGFLVTTLELTSLHLARKAVRMLTHLGFARERVQVLVNRTGKDDGLRLPDLEKVIQSPAQASFPNDSVSLERMLALGEPLTPESELGKAVEEFAGRLAGVVQSEKKRGGVVLDALPIFSQSSSGVWSG